MGKIKKEINAHGEATFRRYDANGNKIYEQGPCKDYRMKYDYDFGNRLIKETKKGKRQGFCRKSFSYNHLNQLTSTRDIYDNKTSYAYDEFGRVIKTTYPSFIDENGETVTPIVYKEYDPMGNITMQKDACGAVTRTQYTIHGKPIRIDYPDGSVEKFEYSKRGNILRSYEKNGTCTYYKYDYQDRVTEKNGWMAPIPSLYGHMTMMHLILSKKLIPKGM